MVDRYTKTMLTLIAGCLLYLSLHTALSVPAAHAATGDITDVNIVRVSLPNGESGIPVRIVNP